MKRLHKFTIIICIVFTLITKVSAQDINHTTIKNVATTELYSTTEGVVTEAGLAQKEKEVQVLKNRLELMKAANIKAELIQQINEELKTQQEKLIEIKQAIQEAKTSLQGQYTKVKQSSNQLKEVMPNQPLNDTEEWFSEKKQELHKVSYKVKEVESSTADVKELVFVERLSLKDRLFWELDLGIAKDQLQLNSISPLLGCQLSERFSLGVGPTWQRVAKAGEEGQQLSSRLMARVNVYRNLFAVQVENLTALSSNLPEANLGQSAQLIGGRFNLPTIKGKQLNFTLLRNLTKSSELTNNYMGLWQAKMGIAF